MPISYWPYAFQATVYLINRLPTLVINNHSLYECVYIRNCLHMSYSGNLDALVFYFLGLIMPINYNITPPNVFFLGLAILTKVAFVFMSQQVISMRLGMWLIFNEFSFPFSSIVAPVSSASLPSSPHFLQHPTMPPILPTPQCSYSPQSSLTHPTSTSTPSISTSATSSTSSPTSFSHSHIPTHPLSPSQNSQMETWSTNVPIFENSSLTISCFSSCRSQTSRWIKCSLYDYQIQIGCPQAQVIHSGQWLHYRFYSLWVNYLQIDCIPPRAAASYGTWVQCAT